MSRLSRILQSATEVRRFAWAHREVELDDLAHVQGRGPSPVSYVEAADLAAVVRLAIDVALTPHQRRITIALLIDEVPIDVLAQRLGSNRNALYKTVHDARTRLRVSGITPMRHEEGDPVLHLVSTVGSVAREGALQLDAAARWSRVERGRHACPAKTGQDTFEQVQVHAADQFGVFLGQGVEGAVAQGYVAARDLRLVAVVLQQVHQDAQVAWAGLFAGQRLAEVVCAPVKNLSWRSTGLFGLGDGSGQEPSGQVVVARGQRDRDLVGGALVELCGATRARTAAPAATGERDCEQALFGEAVEMERRALSCDLERVSHVVTTERDGMGTHVVVDAPSGRLIQTGHRSHGRCGLGGSPLRGHVTQPWRHDSRSYDDSC